MEIKYKQNSFHPFLLPSGNSIAFCLKYCINNSGITNLGMQHTVPQQIHSQDALKSWLSVKFFRFQPCCMIIAMFPGLQQQKNAVLVNLLNNRDLLYKKLAITGPVHFLCFGSQLMGAGKTTPSLSILKAFQLLYLLKLQTMIDLFQLFSPVIHIFLPFSI